jgi:hypothetical protein
MVLEASDCRQTIKAMPCASVKYEVSHAVLDNSGGDHLVAQIAA